MGIDIIQPLNKTAGNLESTLIGVGGDFRLAKLFKISSGANFIIGNRPNIPLGFTYSSRKGRYEAGIATKDIFTYLRGNAEGSTFSLATGYLRFKLGTVNHY